MSIFGHRVSLFQKVSYILIIMFISNFINIPYVRKVNTEDVQAATITGNTVDYSDDVDKIKILEIGPKYKSLLTGGTYSALSLPKKINKSIGNQDVQITYMDMPLFISMIDDIEGKYDIVVISQSGGYYENPQSSTKAAKSGNKTTKSISLTEYESENDITDKRAKLITDMINKGQLVYIDKSILTNSLNKTKLYKNFASINKSNLIKESSSNITLSNIVNKYQDIDIKRPKIQQFVKPSAELREDRSMDFTVTLKTESQCKVKLKLYLDSNNDGLFDEHEYMASKIVDSDNQYSDYTINYMLSKKYKGFIEYKIDAVILNDDDSESVKSSVNGSSVSKALSSNDKKKINVLQIYPDDEIASTYGGSNKIQTVLTNNNEFKKKIKLDDFDIEITNVKVKDFMSGSYTKYSKDNLEKNYDMLIIGFCDNYNEKDINNTKAIENIENYIKDGYSIMFTHDTISSNINGDSGRCVELTKNLRDYVGQARYKDPYRDSEEDLIKKYDPITNQYVTKYIPHDDSKTNTLGETDFASNWEATYSEKVKLINQSQITEYPYKLSNYEQGMEVHTTHTQWFQLNLEDEDVVPWYNMVPRSSSTFSTTDSRNYYYTYSKRNITYSGTGHRGVKDVTINGRVDATIPDTELKLFVNTIVKAYRGGNHKPELENEDQNNTIINDNDISLVDADRSKEYTFFTTPLDEDLDKVKVEVRVESQLLSPENIQIVSTGEKYDGSFIDTDTKLKVIIPNSMIKDKQPGTSFDVNVKVFDDMLASNSSSFKVNVKNTVPEIVSYDKEAFAENDINSDSIDSDKSMVNLCRNSQIVLNGTKDLYFVSIPKDYDDDKMNVYISTKGLNKKEFSSKFISKKSNDRLETTIPKDYFEDMKKGESFEVIVTVKDIVSGKECDSYEEKFTINIGNHSPTIQNFEQDSGSNYIQINQDTDGDGIDNANNTVNSASDCYSFLSKIRDIDSDDTLELNVYCENNTGDGYNLVSTYNEDAKDEPNLEVSIPKKYYERSEVKDSDEDLSKFADKKRGETFRVKTTLKDCDGAEVTHIFTVKIQNNNIPRIVAYEIDSKNQIIEDGTSENKMAFGKSYSFYAKVNDLDVQDDLKVSLSIDNMSRTVLVDGESIGAKVFKDGDMFEIQIPKDRTLLRSSKFKVTLKVTDSYAESNYYSFYVDVTDNNPPTITNYESGTTYEILDGKTSINSISIGNMFLFDIMPKDIDEDLLDVTVTVHNKDELQKIYYPKSVQSKIIKDVTIKRNNYLNIFKGEKFLVDVEANDGYGGSAKKSFYVKVKDNNKATLTNYEQNGTDVIEDKKESVNKPNVNSIFNKENDVYVLSENLEGEDYKFVSIPSDTDDNILKENVYIKIGENKKFVKTYQGKPNEPIQVTINRSFFSELKRGDTFTVITELIDNLGDSVMVKDNISEQKSFIVRIKENNNPKINCYDISNEQINDNLITEATKENDYSLKSEVLDSDDSIVKLTIKAEDIIVYSGFVLSSKMQDIIIPKECYSTKKRGQTFNVNIFTEDQFGGSDQEQFTVKIKDNEIPTINNYTAKLSQEEYLKDTEIESNGSGGIAKTFKDYVFVTIPQDKDDKYLDIKILADEKVIYQKENVISAEEIKVSVPKEIYKDKKTGEKTNIIVYVQDKNGGSNERAFYVEIKANNPPTISNYYNEDIVYNSYDTPSNDSLFGKKEIKDKEIVYEKNEETDEGYVFCTVPTDDDENDKENLHVIVTAGVRGNKTEIYNQTNKKSGEKIKVTVPKELYKELDKNEAVNVIVTVEDSSLEKDSKEFDLIMNKAPTVFNKDINNITIKDNGQIDVTRYHDFNFYSVCNDLDEEKELRLSLYINDEKLQELAVKPEQFGYSIPLTIPNEKFNFLDKNEKLQIKTVVTDSKGKSSSKVFFINMINYVPKVTNYDVKNFKNIEEDINNDNMINSYEDINTAKNNAIETDKYLDYKFLSVANDFNELEDLYVNVTAKVISKNEEKSESKTVSVKANGKLISDKDPIKSNTILAVTVPQDVYKYAMPGDYVCINVEIKDEFGDSSNNSFYIKIASINPTVKHGIINSNQDNDQISINDNILNRVRTYDTIHFGAIGTDVYCNDNEKVNIRLNIAPGINIKDKIRVYRIIDNDGNIIKSNEWTMNYDTIQKCYTLDLSYYELTSIGKIEPKGMTLIIKYDGLMSKKSSIIQENFINNLQINSSRADVTVFMKDDQIDKPAPMF